jgi:hypothetical protein
MKVKDIIIIVLLLGLAVASYVIGYRNGQLRDSEMRELRVRLRRNLRLYEAAQSGDLPKVQRDLGMFILGQTRTFEEKYGPPGSDDSFAERFAYAKGIATQVESRLVRFDSPRDLINALGETNTIKK